MHSPGERKKFYVSEECVFGFSSIVKSTGGGVCMRVRTDSPATPLPKQLTASTTISDYLMRVAGINKVRKHMDFGPIG